MTILVNHFNTRQPRAWSAQRAAGDAGHPIPASCIPFAPLAGEGSLRAGVVSPSATGPVGSDVGGASLLTPAQREVVRLYALGFQGSEIAAKLGISPRTVYQHAHDARKRGVHVPRNHGGGPERKHDYLEFAKLAREGKTGHDIARHFSICPSVVCRALKLLRDAGALVPPTKYGKRNADTMWTRQRVLEAAKIAAEEGVRVAAERVGTTPKAVQQALYRARISLRRIRAKADQAAVDAL